MALKNVLPLDPVVNVIVNLSAVSAARKAFNLALLVGDVDSSVVTDFKNNRVVTYDSLNSMLEAGFKMSDRLYKAAALVFGQAKTPPSVAIGKITSTEGVWSKTYTITTNAVEGDTLTLLNQTFTFGTDFSAGEDENSTAIAIADALRANETIGNNYDVKLSNATITLTEKIAGNGQPGDIEYTGTLVVSNGRASKSASKKETPVETITACRSANYEWYVVNYCGDLTDKEILDIAEYTEACTPSTVFAYTTSADECKEADGGIFGKIKAKSYRQVIGQYSTDHPDAICAIIGWAMGAMTGTANSAYTLAYKTETGVQAENYVQQFTTNTVNNIKANNGNVFINRGREYNVFEEGKVGDGSWFDEIIYLDKFKNDMQLAIMDILAADNKVPQTEAGMNRIKNAIKVVCTDMQKIGFISEGTWLGANMLDLNYGDTLPGGYLIQSESIASQSQADRDARKAPNIYVSLKLAGAIHHVTVQVDVNR